MLCWKSLFASIRAEGRLETLQLHLFPVVARATRAITGTSSQTGVCVAFRSSRHDQVHPSSAVPICVAARLRPNVGTQHNDGHRARTLVTRFTATAFLLGALLGATATFALSSSARPPLNLRSGASVANPSGTVEALLFHGSGDEVLDLLGTEHRVYLALRRNGTTAIVDSDLLLGRGTYECAVHRVRWRDNEHVVVERTIDDAPGDVEFDVQSYTWRPATVIAMPSNGRH